MVLVFGGGGLFDWRVGGACHCTSGLIVMDGGCKEGGRAW